MEQLIRAAWKYLGWFGAVVCAVAIAAIVSGLVAVFAVEPGTRFISGAVGYVMVMLLGIYIGRSTD